MTRAHLRTAVRNLLRHRGQTAILALGLALGLAACFLIAVWVESELSYDRFHANAGRIVRLAEKIQLEGSGEYCASGPVALGPAVLREMPTIVEKQTRFMQLRATSYLLENGAERRFNEKRLYFADPGAFDMFSFVLKKGDPAAALAAPNSVVLTETAARKYFPENEDPLGRTLRFEGNRDLLVTGIAADVPPESHLHFDALVSFATLDNILTEPQRNGFYWNPAWTYVQLREGATEAQLAAALPALIKKYYPDEIRDAVTHPLQPLTDIHLHSTGLVGELEPNGSLSYVRIFSAVAVIVLLLAVINFVNLATAGSIRRVREVGVRKVLGAGRASLAGLAMGEAVLTAALSGLLGLGLVAAALPYFNDLTGKAFSLADIFEKSGWFALATVATGLLAGIYPAFHMSGFRPALAVKGVFERPGSRSRLQQGLVVAQFAVSAALIVGTLTAHRQLALLRGARLGFDREDVLILPVSRCSLASIDRFDDFRRRLLQSPDIRSATALEEPLGVRFNTHTYRPEGASADRQFGRLFVRDGFLETFGIELLAGRDFSKTNRLSDTSSVIVNEAMLRYLGWGSPTDALQKRLNNQRVAGVVRDFHFASLHTAIEPFVLHVPRNDGANGFFVQYMAVKAAPGRATGAIAFLEKTWREAVPDRAFEYSFLDSEHELLYRSEARLGRVGLVFNGLAILIACLGLVGLAAFAMARRVREVGIRKVLGASGASVAGLLSKDFLRLVVLALCIASPVAYFLMKKWLDGFAYRVDIGWGVFAAAAVLSVGVAAVAVGSQALRAALADPVGALRSE